MTSGSIWKSMVLFAMPIFIGNLFQQMYNIADSLVAGKFLGEQALAAVGNSYEITLIFLAFATGCNIGCSVLASKLFGAKKFGDLKTAVYTVMLFSVALCGVMMLAGLTCVTASAILLWQAFKPHDPAKLFVNQVASEQMSKEEPKEN